MSQAMELPKGMTRTNLEALMTVRREYLAASGALPGMEKNGTLNSDLMTTAIRAWESAKIIERRLVGRIAELFPEDSKKREAELAGARMDAMEIVRETILYLP
ncbi:hypothetical protein LAL4801_05768 [Roseibium aggregatum]|uniref:Uncharacterized protein n=2 Tax=Roseibium aggregatum TaxID=187304 RepID=A0A0M6YB38_9HYPH|nr:hypothetical protein LAL4801_05768 [Roseibium aggregatum]